MKYLVTTKGLSWVLEARNDQEKEKAIADLRAKGYRQIKVWRVDQVIHLPNST